MCNRGGGVTARGVTTKLLLFLYPFVAILMSSRTPMASCPQNTITICKYLVISRVHKLKQDVNCGNNRVETRLRLWHCVEARRKLGQLFQTRHTDSGNDVMIRLIDVLSHFQRYLNFFAKDNLLWTEPY